MDTVAAIKQRFGIVGDDLRLNRAIEKAAQVAPTDISVLVSGESGVGKEYIPLIIHALSARKHSKYIAVNCGAIPEGTIDSELFGHEKGSFTGATATRSGYFEEANMGTIFLDEVGELPLTTQVRLLRVLENGEFIKVGSSKVQKTDVRIVAATNVNMHEAIKKGKFREDLYYRLSTVEIHLPPLRDRKGDIHLLFRKFASDFSQKYRMPTVRLNDEAALLLASYHWSGNIRQLRNVAEQISVLEKERVLTPSILKAYLPNEVTVPALVDKNSPSGDFSNEREILYKVLFDMKSDLNDLKKLTLELIKSGDNSVFQEKSKSLINKIYGEHNPPDKQAEAIELINVSESRNRDNDLQQDEENNNLVTSYDFSEEVQESLSLQKKELEFIKKALDKNMGKRKAAADELGISERTLYRKLKQYDLE